MFRFMMVTEAMVCLLFGLGLTVLPAFVYGVFGADLDAAGLWPARQYGAVLLGLAAIAWFGRGTRDAPARLGVVSGMVLYHAIGFVVTVVLIAGGVLGSVAWLAVGIYAYFTLGFGYLLLVGARRPRRLPGAA